MGAQACVWDGAEVGQRSGQIIVGPWPGIEEILEESEPAVVMDRAELAAAAPAIGGMIGAGPVVATRPVRGRLMESDLFWDLSMAAVLVLMLLGAVVGAWQLFQISGGFTP